MAKKSTRDKVAPYKPGKMSAHTALRGIKESGGAAKYVGNKELYKAKLKGTYKSGNKVEDKQRSVVKKGLPKPPVKK